VLNSKEVEEIGGHYHLIEPNGSFSSLTFTARSDPWLYKKENLLARMGSIPFFPQPAQKLPAVDMSFREVIQFDNGDKGLWRIDGVAVFSSIPGTDLILASIAGETLQIFDSDSGEMTPRSEEQKNMNVFFVLKRDGKALTIKLFSENDEGLVKAFDDPSAPLPTDKLLNWLKKNATSVFDDDNLPTYLRSTPEQKARVEENIYAAFAQNIAVKKKEKKKAAAKAESDASVFDMAVSEAAARALREAIADSGGNHDTRQRKRRARSHAHNADLHRQSDQSAPSYPAAPQNDPAKITSIDGFYLVSHDNIFLVKVQKNAGGDVEEIGIYERFRAKPFGLRHFQRNNYSDRGYWYPDSQQFYTQGSFSNGRCGGWSDMNWSKLYEFDELMVDGKSIKTWTPDPLSLTPIPAGREAKRVCTGRRIDRNSCKILRCIKWSDPRNFPNIYLVRSRDDALLIYNDLFGNR